MTSRLWHWLRWGRTCRGCGLIDWSWTATICPDCAAHRRCVVCRRHVGTPAPVYDFARRRWTCPNGIALPGTPYGVCKDCWQRRYHRHIRPRIVKVFSMGY